MSDKAVREHVLNFLKGRGAHVDFERAIKGMRPELKGAMVDGIPWTPWMILEHLRLAQWDILEFSRDANHVSPEFPQGYWPESESPPDEKSWDESVNSFRADLRAMQNLVEDPSTDIYARIPHGDGQTILREALLIADHNAYHIGQLVAIRRALGDWGE